MALKDNTFINEVAPTCTYRIWMAGDYDDARRVLREIASGEGFCASVQRADYIYTGGEEAGFCVTLINYPRFPKESWEMVNMARRVAAILCDRLHQGSYTIEGPETSAFYSRRGSDADG